jgi:molybdopterin/thiamine biosynthesis adenylyltransferase
MDDRQLLRYSRHILLDEVGIEGQERVLGARVLIIGAGGLGSPAALYLAASGVGRITLVDDDEVDLTNLQRQVMHTTARIGQPKVESGREACARSIPTSRSSPCASAPSGERCGNWWPTAMSYSTAATTSPPARPSTAPAWRPACRWWPAP